MVRLVNLALGEDVDPASSPEQIDRFVNGRLVNPVSSNNRHNLSKTEKVSHRSIMKKNKVLVSCNFCIQNLNIKVRLHSRNLRVGIAEFLGAQSITDSPGRCVVGPPRQGAPEQWIVSTNVPIESKNNQQKKGCPVSPLSAIHGSRATNQFPDPHVDRLRSNAETHVEVWFVTKRRKRK